jgi:hypothetical protein
MRGCVKTVKAAKLETIAAALRDYIAGELENVLRVVYKNNGTVFGPIHGAGFPLHTHTLGGGMHIRNFLRSVPECKNWAFEDLESGWVHITEIALGLTTKKEHLYFTTDINDK